MYEELSNENRSPDIKRIRRKSWQHYYYVSILPSVGYEICIIKTHRSTLLFRYWTGGERSVKWVFPALEMETSKEEQRGVVRFLVAEGDGRGELRRCMSVVYCEFCTSGRRYSTKDAHHCKTIYARDKSIKPLFLMRLRGFDGLIRENRRITEKQIRVQVGISHGPVYAIIKDHLQVPKQCQYSRNLGK